MILFKPCHKLQILSGAKTQTRRTWQKCRVKVRSIHQAKTELFGKPFARLRVTSVQEQRLGEITLADAQAEGYSSIDGYKEVFQQIYGFWDPMVKVWVIDFELVEACI